MKEKIIILTTFFFLFTKVFAQGKIETNVGIGFMEALSLKVKYGKKIQIGIGQGFAGKYIFQSSMEFYYHLGNKNEQIKRKSAYLMVGVGSTFLSQGYNDQITTFYPRYGVAISLSKRTGINLDIGPILILIKDTDGSSNWLPFISGSVHYYFKI